MGGAGFDFAGSQNSQEPAAKRARQEERHTCLPVTVRMVQDAAEVQDQNDEEFQIHGLAAGLVLFVGTVEGLVEQATGIEFTLNDATGRIKVVHYAGAGAGADIGKFVPGAYVAVSGTVRPTPSLKVSAQFMRNIASPDEVSFHVVEATHAALRLTGAGGQSISKEETSAAAKEQQARWPATPQGQPATLRVPPAVGTGVAAAPVADKEKRQAVLSYICQSQVNAGEQGVSLDSILSKLGDVYSTIKLLVAEGEVYNTSDEQHFRTTNEEIPTA